MSEKPEYVVLLDSNTISAGRRINTLAAEGYEVVAQSSSSLPGQESGWFTTWTLRLRPEWRHGLSPLAVQDDRLAALEKRLAELETLTSQQKLRALEEHKYVSGLMVDLRALQTAEKDDRKAICDHDYNLSCLEREVKHLRANLEANIERTDRLLAIQKATEEMQKVEEEPPQIGVLELRKLHERLTALESRQRRLEAKIGRAFWTNTEVGDMKCRVLISARTEEAGHE